MSVGFDGEGEDCFLPLVHLGQREDFSVECRHGGVKLLTRFSEKTDHDRGVVDEALGPDVMNCLSEIFVGPGCLSQPQGAVFDADAVLILVGLVLHAVHVSEAGEVDGFEFI